MFSNKPIFCLSKVWDPVSEDNITNMAPLEEHQIVKFEITFFNRSWISNISDTNSSVFQMFEQNTTHALNDLYGNLTGFVRVKLVRVSKVDKGATIIAVYHAMLKRNGSLNPEDLRDTFERARDDIFSGTSMGNVEVVELDNESPQEMKKGKMNL